MAKLSLFSAERIAQYFANYLDNLWNNPHMTQNVAVLVSKDSRNCEFHASREPFPEGFVAVYTVDMYRDDIEQFTQYEMPDRIVNVVEQATLGIFWGGGE